MFICLIESPETSGLFYALKNILRKSLVNRNKGVSLTYQTNNTMKTTLNKIRQHAPCEDSWKKLLQSLGKTEADDTEVTVRYILDLLGFKDAIWVLRAVQGHDREIRLFACDCAESVLHLFENKYPVDNRPRNAIEVARRYANGEATVDELNKASAAARAAAWEAAMDAAGDSGDAAWSAAWYAAGDAASGAAGDAARAAAGDSGDAAGDASRAAEREKQREFLLKYI